MVKREVIINFSTNISIYSIIYYLIIVFDVPSSKTIFTRSFSNEKFDKKRIRQLLTPKENVIYLD